MQQIPSFVVRHLQEATRMLGQAVEYRPASGAPISIRARVRAASDLELANAIENYRLVCTFAATDFAAAPLKGDEVIIGGARHAVMWVREITLSGELVDYQCGVQG